MRMGFGLDIEQSQKLIMTPELRQAITILQLSSLELESYVEQQLQENPLLEQEEDQFNAREDAGHDSNDSDGDSSNNEDEKYDIDWKEYFHDSSDLGVPQQEKYYENRDYTFENLVREQSTLDSHLMFQLQMTDLGEEEKDIGEYIIGNIDSNGYLQLSQEELAEHLQVSLSRVENVLQLIQEFEPPGVGAGSLQECLLIQARQFEYADKLVEEVINHHLNDIAKGKYNQLAQLLGVKVEEIQKAADILKKLDPKPGRSFASSGDNRHIIPDVVLEKVEGEYIVIINDNSMPRLTINSIYKSVLSENGYDNKTRKFVESKLNAATWLIKSIEQRRLTLYKVANCLVELQRDFLDHGIKYLRPLNLKKVAELVDLHESTVSRATSNKYIQTPRGVFEMKFFFSSGLGRETGESVSSQSIKKMLQEIIDSEDPKHPLNDQRISEIFAGEGIKISRRTIAKYRDELGIPPIRKRKRY